MNMMDKYYCRHCKALYLDQGARDRHEELCHENPWRLS